MIQRIPIVEIVFCHTQTVLPVSWNGRRSRWQWLEPTLPERALRVSLIQYPQNFCSARLKKFSLQKRDTKLNNTFYRNTRRVFQSKYRFEIPPLQRCGRCRAHVHCISTSVGERQTALRQHSSVFTFVFTYLKCLRSLKMPPTVKYAL